MRFALLLAALLSAVDTVRADTSALLDRLVKVGREGAGNQDAVVAWRELVAEGKKALLPTLGRLDVASPTAANWLRSAVDAIVEKQGKDLPADDLATFLKDSKNGPIGRRLAFEILTKLDPETPAKFLPGFISDPSLPLRRDAIAMAFADVQASKAAVGEKVARLNTLFQAARDPDQVEALAAALEKLGQKPNITEHFNFITTWYIAGPFDNTKGVGFATVYPPEQGVDLKAQYVGKEGAKFGWTEMTTDNKQGIVDLAARLNKVKGAVAYAYAVIESSEERSVNIRVGCITAVQVFLNGKKIFEHEEYHHGMSIDQYVAVGTLKKGRNEILIKTCQNEQTEPWAQKWEYQARICDSLGGKVAIQVRKAD